ncbi:MAG: hypothetical protein EOM62_13910 [Bacteroidia bacterium]|nr:hypothetical protein [Bacteroidia bacterium]
MASYSFQIRKADHSDKDGNFDLHVHIYRNDYRKRKLLGRYRLPTLEPVFPNEPELTQDQVNALAGWLSDPQQIKKLDAFLKETLFNTHKLARISSQFGEVKPENGETYINIRIPIARRIK